MNGAALEHVLLPELPERVVLEPLGELVGAESPKGGCTLLAIDNNDVLSFEVVEERRRLRGNDDLRTRRCLLDQRVTAISLVT